MTFESFLQELDGRVPLAVENLLCLHRVPSTNGLARRIAKECLEQDTAIQPSALVALEQTGGRGRLGRRWESPSGLGIYASLLLPSSSIRPLQEAPMAVAVALSREIDRLLDRSVCRIKWPNDLLIDGRKVGGILMESFRSPDEPEEGALIVGFGVNHGHEEAALPLPTATSLRLHGGTETLATTAIRLLGTVAAELLRTGDPGEGEAPLLTEYTTRSAHRPGDPLRCQIGDQMVDGAFDGFDEQGFLRLRTAEGSRVIASAEVIEG